jgi:hypothetical protein
MKKYNHIVVELTESLDCDAGDILDVVNILNLTEYWVENRMLDVCEDNEVMRKCLKDSLDDFLSKYKP